MEKCLKELFEQEGAKIFNTDYQLSLELLEEFREESVRDDIYFINAILGGNAFYRLVVEALENGNVISHTRYNVFVDQMYSNDRFWKNEYFDPSRFERLLRMLLRVASIDVSDIPMTILQSKSSKAEREDLMQELSFAQNAYESKDYRVAFEKSIVLFENGVSSAASILGRAYYNGDGTIKDYNKALFYLSYPHNRTTQQDKEERVLLNELLQLRDKTAYSSIICVLGTIVLLLFMLIMGVFVRHILFALFSTGFLIAGSVLFILTYRKRLIFDFSLWFLVLGCMFLITLVL